MTYDYDRKTFSPEFLPHRVIDHKSIESIASYIPDLKPQFQALGLKLHEWSKLAEQKIKSLGSILKRFFVSEKSLPALKPLPGGQEFFKLEQDGCILHAPKDPGKGEIIFDKFLDLRNRTFCKEVAIRARTLDIYSSQLQAERDYLLRELGKPSASQSPRSANEDRKLAIRRRIINIDQKMKLHAEMKATWASTNTPRFLFEKFGRQTAKEIGLPVLVNLRTHAVEFEDEGIAVNRSAAVTDFTHAETNLLELRDYLILNDTDHLHELPLARKLYFKAYYNIDVTNPIQYWPVYQRMKNNIYLAYGTSDPALLPGIISERRDLLRRQVLQDLLLHFKNKPAADEIVIYGRTALLDPVKRPLVDAETGYYTDERNEIMDMKAIYDELNGAKVVFDLQENEGPFFDLKGLVHMPKSCSTVEFRKAFPHATIETFLINVSVQGNTRNTGLQMALNSQALHKLEAMDLKGEKKKLFDSLNKKLQYKAETNFTTAHKAIQLMRELGYCSVDCYGGKDRTGYALALETYYAIRRKLRQKARNDPAIAKKYHSILAKFASQLVSSESVAIKIVEDNTGYTVMKLAPFQLKLYVSGNGWNWLMGVGKRLTHYLEASLLYLPKKLAAQPSRHDESILYDKAA